MDYNRYSPWKKTEQTSWYLDIYNPIIIKQADDDTFFTITEQYHQKPMALAKNLYDSERLYYVFAILNPDLEDPVYDFTAGRTIRVPSNSRLQKIIGS